MTNILLEVQDVIRDRIRNPREGSYVSSLISEGENAILRKIGEEALELILAAKSGSRDQVIHEAADLIFHTLILLNFEGLSLEDVLRELERRRRK